MTEPMTTLVGGPSDQSLVPTANFMNGRNTVMVATATQTTCPASASDHPLRSSGLGTRSAVYELVAGDPARATFVGWSDEVAMTRIEAADRDNPR